MSQFLNRFRLPSLGEHVRVDAGVRSGDRVTPYYDSLLAKLIVWGEDRAGALRRLRRALEQFEIVGVGTNLDFLRALCREDWLEQGAYDTTSVEANASRLILALPLTQEEERFVLAAGAAVWLSDLAAAARPREAGAPWATTDGWRLEGRRGAEIEFLLNDRLFKLQLYPRGDSAFQCAINGEAASVEFTLSDGALRLGVDGVWREVGIARQAAALVIALHGRNHRLTQRDPLRLASESGKEDRRLISPLPARVVRVHTSNGQSVKSGAGVVTLEVMKTEFVLRAPRDGAIAGLDCREGDWVPEGATVASISDGPAPAEERER